jgi:hypothetical protein
MFGPTIREAQILFGTHGPGIPTSRTVGFSRRAGTRIQAMRTLERELPARIHGPGDKFYLHPGPGT